MADLIKKMIENNKKNAINVSEQPVKVKDLLSTAVSYTTADEYITEVGKNKRYTSQKIELEQDIAKKIFNMQYKSRPELLRIAIICATSVNAEAQAILMHHISKSLGEITQEDYSFIAKLLIQVQDKELVGRVNKFLSKNLQGFENLHVFNYAHYYL